MKVATLGTTQCHLILVNIIRGTLMPGVSAPLLSTPWLRDSCYAHQSYQTLWRQLCGQRWTPAAVGSWSSFTLRNPALVRTDMAWYYHCLLSEPCSTADNYHSFPFFHHQHGLALSLLSALFMFMFSGDSRLLEMVLSGFNFLIFYSFLPHSISPSVSLFHLSKPGP